MTEDLSDWFSVLLYQFAADISVLCLHPQGPTQRHISTPFGSQHTGSYFLVHSTILLILVAYERVSCRWPWHCVLSNQKFSKWRAKILTYPCVKWHHLIMLLHHSFQMEGFIFHCLVIFCVTVWSGKQWWLMMGLLGRSSRVEGGRLHLPFLWTLPHHTWKVSKAASSIQNSVERRQTASWLVYTFLAGAASLSQDTGRGSICQSWTLYLSWDF